MIATDEEALMCDLAEVYNIYDYESLSPIRVATFSVGLRDNSRIKLIISGQKFPLETILLATAADRLALLLWSKTKDAAKGRNMPEMIAAKLTEKKKERDYLVFDSPEAFEQAMAEINRREGK